MRVLSEFTSAKYRSIWMSAVLFVLTAAPLFSYNIYYAEQYYKLYHQNFYQYPENFEENIWYLERALQRPFMNPLNALAHIEDKSEWRRYQALFYLHVNLEMVKQYRLWAAEYDKRVAYFYNEPWKDQNLESLEIAEHYYRTALYYWDQALNWWARLSSLPYQHLDEIQYWEDERVRIESGDLDYGDIIETDLKRLSRVRRDFESMDETTY